MVLRYLLSRAGQWTNLMQEMMNKATEDWLNTKLRRLIAIVDSRFGPQDVYSLINSDDQNDEQFARALTDELYQSDLLKTLTDAQLVHILMENLLKYLPSE